MTGPPASSLGRLGPGPYSLNFLFHFTSNILAKQEEGRQTDGGQIEAASQGVKTQEGGYHHETEDEEDVEKPDQGYLLSVKSVIESFCL